MKFQTLLLSAVTALTLSACATTPKTLPSGEPATAFVLEQIKNIGAEPQTSHNSARLIKQSNNCDIEFIAEFNSGKATEHWIFEGDQLISAFSNIQSNEENKQIVFDPQDPAKIQNFHALKNNFKASHLKQCQNI